MGRLTSGPLGSSTYGDPAHLHAATSIGSGSTQYTASYDASGDMLCRAASGSTTCTGSTPSGAQLSYDNEGRLVGWQNVPGGTPTSTASFAYDGEGNRVAEVSSNSPTTYYLGGWEEVTGSTVTKYYPVGMAGLPQPVKVGTTLSYLATDGLGSMSEAVDGAGNVLGQQLYAPYGGTRYSSGTMPTSKGFTGQRADAATGLDYYNARYYDPLAGQFTSADTVLAGKGYDLWGLSRYAYVEGNPESRTDPMGHRYIDPGSNNQNTSTPQTGQWDAYNADVAYIEAHRYDPNTMPSIVYDDRSFDGDILKVFGIRRTREEIQETNDGEVIMNYFGLSVWIQDRADGTEAQAPQRADYLVGLFQEFPSREYPYTQFNLVAGVPMDLIYPQAGTAPKAIDKSARDKAKAQAPIIVIDMSENTALRSMSPDQLQAFADSMINPARGTTVPKRVIFILDGNVELDDGNWGPRPVGVA